MRLSRCIAILVLVSTSALAAAAGFPEKVAERLDQVVTPSEADEFQGSYIMSITTVVQKPNGKSREEVVFDAEVENTSEGERTRRLLRYIENGEDVTEKQREDFESNEQSKKKKDDDDDDSDLANPFGETADLYQFGEPASVGSETIVTFAPAPGHEDDRNVATGRLAWDPVSQEPTWIEMTAVHAPKPLKKLAIRLEFNPQGDDIFVSRMVTDGLARVLMMQREFHMDLRFEDIRPAGAPTEE